MSYLDRDNLGIYRDTKNGPGPHLMGADTLIGEDVYNRQNESLGDIKEIMIDMARGEVAYAVLSFGGWLGMGDKLFAVPWQALELDTNNKRFVLDASKAQLKTAPGFDKDNWPDMAGADFGSQIHNFYHTQQNVPGRMTASGSVMGQGSASMQSATNPGSLSQNATVSGSGASISRSGSRDLDDDLPDRGVDPGNY